MHRIVANCFKAIAFAIIFVIVWDVGFYLWRANALNQRMESVAVSIQEVVSKNNYLPEEEKEMFRNILNTIRADMNNSDVFIEKISWNYAYPSSYQPQILDSDNKNIVRYRMDTPASYGDVMVIEIHVLVNATVWGQIGGIGNRADSFVRDSSRVNFTYTYLVPCLKYTTVTN